LQEAIADAKIVKQTALAKAKSLLDEAYTPVLTSMLNAKLNELEEDDFDFDDDIDIDLLYEEDDKEDKKDDDKKDKKDDKKDNKKDDKKDDKKDTKKSEPKDDDEKDIKDMSPEEVEEFIRQIAAEEFQKLEASEDDLDMGDEFANDDFDDSAEDIDLGGEFEDDMDSDLDLGDDMGVEDDMDTDDLKEDDDVDIDALLNELDDEKDEKIEELEDNLFEALTTINTLKKQLNETKLVNNKLKYINRLLENHNLDSKTKNKIIESFDKVKTPNEGKILFESLNDRFKVTNKNKSNLIKENLGLASKPVGSFRKNTEILPDSNRRWMKLAGLTEK
jgi:hypothetical protein